MWIIEISLLNISLCKFVQAISDSTESNENTKIFADKDIRQMQTFTDEDPTSFAFQIASGMVWDSWTLLSMPGEVLCYLSLIPRSIFPALTSSIVTWPVGMF